MPYRERLKKIIKGLPARTGVVRVEVRHDSWCDIYKGRGCNCTPDVVTVPPPPEVQHGMH